MIESNQFDSIVVDVKFCVCVCSWRMLMGRGLLSTGGRKGGREGGSFYLAVFLSFSPRGQMTHYSTTKGRRAKKRKSDDDATTNHPCWAQRIKPPTLAKLNRQSVANDPSEHNSCLLVLISNLRIDREISANPKRKKTLSNQIDYYSVGLDLSLSQYSSHVSS